MAKNTLFGPLTDRTAHLCVDMQLMFAPGGPWAASWSERILPSVAAIARHVPDRTVFTRFIPPRRPDDTPGAWRDYYMRWRDVTLERLDPAMLQLMPPLAELVPPAHVIDKSTYSAFSQPKLPQLLRERKIDSLVVTGLETDVCVLATVLGAVDYGYRVILVADAVCSSSDAGHDKLLDLYNERFSEQIHVTDCETLLARWNR
jgi:nicotinamidase-related amidase